MQWINFIHLYQPSTSEDSIIREATEKSYYRIIRALEERPATRFTMNISGCLILRWVAMGYTDIIRRIGILIERGQLELVGTASYHPLLPLIPDSEIRRQVLENESILKKYFGRRLRLKGFFMPEMAYSLRAAKLVKQLGYQYLVLGEVAMDGRAGGVDCTKIYEDRTTGLKVILRNRADSKTYVPRKILRQLRNGRTLPVITATDAELYGLRFSDPDALFEKMLRQKNLETATISQYIEGKPTVRMDVKASSWESTEEELAAGNPYALWNDKNNHIHRYLWRLAYLAIIASEKFPNDKMKKWTRWHLSRGLASCTFWWASGRDFRKVYGPVAWHPDAIEKGLNELIRSIRSINDPASRPIKLKAEKIYLKTMAMIWSAHWNKHWASDVS